MRRSWRGWWLSAFNSTARYLSWRRQLTCSFILIRYTVSERCLDLNALRFCTTLPLPFRYRTLFLFCFFVCLCLSCSINMVMMMMMTQRGEDCFIMKMSLRLHPPGSVPFVWFRLTISHNRGTSLPCLCSVHCFHI